MSDLRASVRACVFAVLVQIVFGSAGMSVVWKGGRAASLQEMAFTYTSANLVSSSLPEGEDNRFTSHNAPRCQVSSVLFVSTARTPINKVVDVNFVLTWARRKQRASSPAKQNCVPVDQVRNRCQQETYCESSHGLSINEPSQQNSTRPCLYSSQKKQRET